MAKNIFNSITLTRQAEYKRTYDRLMERARGRAKEKGVHENHHIFPRSMGGSNEKSNIVALTYKEHFLAHWLLTKFTEGRARISMLKALSKMKRAGKKHKNRVASGWMYEVARRANSEAMGLWNKTPEGQEAAMKAGATRRAFNATPEGQVVSKEAGKKIGATLSAFYATPEGKAAAKKGGAARRVFYATPEGKAAAKERGKKISSTKKARGSQAGEKHHNATVTEETVRQIRTFEGSHTEAALHFGITRQMSYRIRTNKTWAHVI
jgi:hypothetical protein